MLRGPIVYFPRAAGGQMAEGGARTALLCGRDLERVEHDAAGARVAFALLDVAQAALGADVLLCDTE